MHVNQYMFVYTISIYLSIYLSMYMYMYMYFYIFIFMYIYISIHLSIHLSFYLSIYLSMYICICAWIATRARDAMVMDMRRESFVCATTTWCLQVYGLEFKFHGLGVEVWGVG